MKEIINPIDLVQRVNNRDYLKLLNKIIFSDKDLEFPIFMVDDYTIIVKIDGEPHVITPDKFTNLSEFLFTEEQINDITSSLTTESPHRN